ncbi:MAG: hydroxyproline-2-epimerase [Verrucomicrobia bacterium]|jgi:4-hydroxyproline epimerase|nr:hydroxyproline-2-epimerase [Verrucomicrobiota bacterium]
MPQSGSKVRVIDSHTEGEPTRVIVEGGPDLGQGTMREKADRFANQFDDFRKTMILEPRGSDILVGALLCPPSQNDCVTGVIFFNNVGLLGMCGHGTMGVAVTLAHLGRVEEGHHRLDTPVGVVGFELKGHHRVTIENVPSWRYRKDLTLDVRGLGKVTGDIAWGGNWFFLTKFCPCSLTRDHASELEIAALKIRHHLDAHDVTGENGAVIDHIEMFAPPVAPNAHSRNFVLCPGGAYDRSPCGTGTSAKLACLAADGHLEQGKTWVQESVIGSRFEGSYVKEEGVRIIPSITGSAFVYSEALLLQSTEDPFTGGYYGHE